MQLGQTAVERARALYREQGGRKSRTFEPHPDIETTASQTFTRQLFDEKVLFEQLLR